MAPQFGIPWPLFTYVSKMQTGSLGSKVRESMKILFLKNRSFARFYKVGKKTKTNVTSDVQTYIVLGDPVRRVAAPCPRGDEVSDAEDVLFVEHADVCKPVRRRRPGHLRLEKEKRGEKKRCLSRCVHGKHLT